jgi:hypothetical protein
VEEDDLVPYEQYDAELKRRRMAPAAPEPDDLVPYEEYRPPAQRDPQQRPTAARYAEAQQPPDDLVPYEEYRPPEAEGKLMTAGREAAHSALPAAGGMLAGAAAGAAGGAMFGLPGMIGGGLLGGLAGGFGTSAVQEETLKAIGFDDSHQRAVNAEANPWSAAGGQLLAAAAGGSPFGVARTAASTIGAGASRGERIADFMARNPRTTSAGIGGVTEAGMQGYQGEFHPEQLAGAVAGGGIFAKNYGYADRAGQIGADVGARYRDRPRNTIGRSGPEESAGVAQEATPVARDVNVGDAHQERGVGSETRYMKPADYETGDKAGMTVQQPGEIDPTLAHVLDAESRAGRFSVSAEEEVAARGRGRREAETEPTLYGEALEREFPTIARPGEEPVPFTRQQRGALEEQMGPPVAEPPQGRPTGEEPTLAPEGTPTPKDFWSYKPATETPTVEQVPEGAIKPGTTQAEFEQLSPGMRREVGRTKPTEAESTREAIAAVENELNTGKSHFGDTLDAEQIASRQQLELPMLRQRLAAAEKNEAPAAVNDQLDIPDFLDRRPKPTPAEAIAARAPGETAEVVPFQPRKSSGTAYNMLTPEGRAAQAAADAMPAEPEAARRPPADFIGKYNPDIRAAEYADEMSRLQDLKPRPIKKLFNNPDKAPPERVAAAQEAIKAWNRQYNAVKRNQKLALERDNEAFRARQADYPSDRLLTREEFDKKSPAKEAPVGEYEGRVSVDADIVNVANDLRKQYPKLAKDINALTEGMKTAKTEHDVEMLLDKLDQTAGFIEQNGGSSHNVKRLRDILNESYDLLDAPMLRHVTERRRQDSDYAFYKDRFEGLTDPNARWRKDMPIEHMLRSLEEPNAFYGTPKEASPAERMAHEHAAKLLRKELGGESLRRTDVIRGRDERPLHSAPLPIGTEGQILETGYAKATGPKLEPRESEMLAARRKGTKPPGEEPLADTAIDAAAAKAVEPEGRGPLDYATANYLINRPGERVKAAKARGVTPEELKAEIKAVLDAEKGKPLPVERGQPMPLTPTGGAPAVTPPAAAAGGAGVPPTGTPPTPAPPGPPIPPNVGAAAAAAGGPPGGGPGTPNPGHAPPQQQSWWKELWRDIQRKTAAHLLGPEGMEARYLIRSSYGPTQRVAEQTADLLKGHTDMVRAMPEADRWAMINHMQGDNRLPFTPTPEQRTFMGKFERMMQEWEAQLHMLDATEQMAFRKDFMAQMYENPTVAPNMFTGLGKRGSAGSTKHRVYDTYEDAKAAGLVPKTSDPIEIGTRYANSIKDFVASRNLIQRGEATDRIAYFGHPQVIGASGSPEPKVTGGPPPGWKKLNGVEKNGKQGYAPADFADVYNNFMDKGFRGGQDGGNVYDAVRNSTNAWTQLELGINAYHLFTMANEAIISDVGGALNKALLGDFSGAGRALKGAPMAWRTRAIEGRRFQQDYLDPNSTNPIAAIVAEANGRPIGRGHAADYSFQDRNSFINKWSPSALQSELKQAGKEISEDFNKAFGPGGTAGGKALFPLQQAGRALQTVAAPIFDKYIPMLKAGAVQGQMKDWHEAILARNPQFDMINNPADRRVAVNAAMKIVDSVDNRFGEMIHDNMFMNATLKQSAQVAMRSFSWAIGAIKEIGGGTAATGKALYELGKTRGANNRFDMTNPEWDPRMAYAIAFPFVVGTISSVYQYLRAGEGPEGWRDLYAPKTGGMVPGVGGKGMVKEHVLMPGYQKDVLGWIHHPVQEAYNKLGGLPTTAIEQISGKDWRGDPIVRAGASMPEAAGQRMAHVFGKLSPISVKNMTKGTEPGSAITTPERLLGFRAPGAHIQDPEGLHRAMDRRDRRIQKAIDKRERKTQLRQNPQPSP